MAANTSQSRYSRNLSESFCNRNGLCDASENQLSCPQDCPSGSPDRYCDGAQDAVCDPDCGRNQDPDCQCNNNGLCDGSEDSLICPSWSADRICPDLQTIPDGRCDPDYLPFSCSRMTIGVKEKLSLNAHS